VDRTLQAVWLAIGEAIEAVILDAQRCGSVEIPASPSNRLKDTPRF